MINTTIDKTINIMKKTYLLCLLGMLCMHYSKGQNLYNDISLYTNPLNYTVNAASFDTTYAREIIITMADTNSFQSLNAILSHETVNGWQTNKIMNHSKPLGSTACNTSLCLYRKNKLQWALVLGKFPLSTKHKIELHFTSLTLNDNSDWSLEF